MILFIGLVFLASSAKADLGFFGEVHGEGSPGVALGFPEPDLHEPAHFDHHPLPPHEPYHVPVHHSQL